ncbi:putative metal-dependent hydrolase [Gramella sp. GC03-9]|uniref:Metal-dependent hydrolase n=1 Tax=Christiangramia oceanisediminis TaxID=2920386 RepID=A0A9X2RA90_9FLAO|nr:putative metal-dependent hydrolase [Gramella oceanisediminis]MCP9201233.1 putative metal-dependent hydrolase [Gramella oceanisediminis]
MTSEELDKIRYPIGKFEFPDNVTDFQVEQWIDILEEFPGKLNRLVRPLSSVQLNTPYRLQGWTIRQLVHHIADSHTNALLRFKWTLTEKTPTIKAYDQNAFALLDDSIWAPAELSLDFLMTLHAKWVFLLDRLDRPSLEKEFLHPETREKVKLIWLLGHYAWHSRHHYAHIENILIKKGWI